MQHRQKAAQGSRFVPIKNFLRKSMARAWVSALLLAIWSGAAPQAHAQVTEFLVNGSMEGPKGPSALPQGWELEDATCDTNDSVSAGPSSLGYRVAASDYPRQSLIFS